MAATFSGWTSTRYAGAATNRDHTLGAATSAGDIILVTVWRSNGATTGAQNHATSAGFTEPSGGHYDPPSAWRMIGTTLIKEAAGGETTINFDWVATDGEANQVIESVIISDADPTSFVASYDHANATVWNFPADSLDNSIHVGATQKNTDLSSSMYPTGDTNITHSAVDWRNGGISLSGGNTASQTLDGANNVNGAFGTVSFNDSNTDLVAEVSTYAENAHIAPDTVVGVVTADITEGTSNFKQAQWSFNNLTDATTFNGAAWVAGVDTIINDTDGLDVATPTTESYDFTAAGALPESSTFQIRVRAKDQTDTFGSWSTRTFTTGVWEYGDPITFTTLADTPVVALAQPGESQQYQMPFAVTDQIRVVCGSDNVVTLEGRIPQIFAGWHDFTANLDGNGDVDTTFTLSGLETPGTYTFEMRGTSAGGNQTVDTNTFTVVAAPPPVASDNTASTSLDTAVVVDVLANDSAVDPSAVLTIETQAVNGTAVVD